MKNLSIIFLFACIVLTSSCHKGGLAGDEISFLDSQGGQGNQGAQAGVVTAGEWNDLDNWSFWQDLMNNQEYSGMPSHWSFYTDKRISVSVTSNSVPVYNARVELRRNQTAVWSARTDNRGRAELWTGLYQQENEFNPEEYELYVNQEKVSSSIQLFDQGINEVQLPTGPTESNRVELSFIVDATGSMGDELEFLKEDLKDVIQRVEAGNASLNILTATVFYRDQGDEYLVRHSGFSADINTTVEFINQQSAGGGGDFPEAVHTALNTTFDELQWSETAKTRIAFLLLDAPPHYSAQVMGDLQASINKAAEKGIKLIPVTASGIDKETEFLMRFFAISTNGTYVFITDDSGVGNDHLEPTVGQYEVELLNDLMVRLIKKYSE